MVGKEFTVAVTLELLLPAIGSATAEATPNPFEVIPGALAAALTLSEALPRFVIVPSENVIVPLVALQLPWLLLAVRKVSEGGNRLVTITAVESAGPVLVTSAV